ncbi:MAG TPA: IS3 family transposase [Nitrospiraceae bacterium]|nr:IS3 family transposase [Nitrospiraceae bacterium]
MISMSRKGNCYDNAPVESFFSSLKNELVRHRHFHDQAKARQAIVEYIEGFSDASACIRRSAIAVQRSSSGRRLVLNPRVCYSGATSPLTLHGAAHLGRRAEALSFHQHCSLDV